MLDAHVAELVRARGKRIVVTGAGGWIGMATLELLADTLGDDFDPRVRCFGASARVLTLRGGQTIAEAPLAAIADLPAEPSWLLHLAFLGKERAEAMTEAEYRAANREIGDTVERALEPIGVEALFVASSGAAAFADAADASPAMRLYGGMKRDDEARFAAWAEGSGRRAVIARVFNVAGPYINKRGSYALASFVADALAARPIAVRSPRPVIRGYVAIRELMSLVLHQLAAAPSDVVRLDTGGEPLELGAVAARVADALGAGPVDRIPVTDPRPDRYVGDPDGYARLLAASGIGPVDLGTAVRETAAFLQEEAR